MRPPLLLIAVLLVLGSCKSTYNDSTPWRFPRYIEWPEKPIPPNASAANEYYVHQGNNGELYLDNGDTLNTTKIDSLKPDFQTIQDSQKTELAKKQLLHWIVTTRRFRNLSAGKQDTILKNIQNIRLGDVHNQYASPEELSDLRFDRLAIASIVLACLGLPFFGVFGLAALIIGARILKFRNLLRTRRMAIAGIVIGALGFAGMIASILALLILLFAF